MVYYHLFLFVPKVLEVRAARGLGNGYSFGDDFYPVWLTSREAILHHRNPYTPEMTREIQVGLFGRPVDASRFPLDPPAGYREFAYPAFVDLIFWPLAYLPFPVLRLALAFLLPTVTAAGVFLWTKAMGLRWSTNLLAIFVLLTLCSYQILEALFAEQVGLFVGFAAAAALAALAANRYVAAGALLALSTIKPQMVLLFVLLLMFWSATKWGQRRRLVESFLAIEILLCLLASLVWPRWWQQWAAILFHYHSYSSPPLVVDLLGQRVGTLLGPLSIAVLVAVAIAIAWRARTYSVTSPEFHLAVALTLTITVIAILPGQAVYDHIVLLPGVLLVVHFRRQLLLVRGLTRWLWWLSAGVLLWQWIAALAIISIRPLISADRFYSVAVFALPIRMAGAFPFALLALLLVIAHRGVSEGFRDGHDETESALPA
jgi:hypothetical protein